MDTDFDGINDNVEWALNLDPRNCDSDGDLLPDGFEYYGFTMNPEWGLIQTNATLQDTDSDGLSDSEEYYGLKALHPTNPILNDSDNDGLLDPSETYSLSWSLGKRVQIYNIGLHKAQLMCFLP